MFLHALRRGLPQDHETLIHRIIARYTARMSDYVPNWPHPCVEPIQASQRLEYVKDCSPFAATLIARHPEWQEQLERSGRLVETSPPREERAAEWTQTYGLDDGLRHFRNQEMLRIIWRELCGLSPLGESMADLSTLAELSLQAAIVVHQAELIDAHGSPRDGEGNPLSLAAIGLGKLGGRELNLSSDIDLVFCYTQHGETDGRRHLSNEEFFARLVRRVIASLADARESGFCFRVDTRLRPFGQAGPLAGSIGAMEQYYQREGRDWERYALIKARPVAGDLSSASEFLNRLRPFIYRRYIDFGAIEALREMQAMVRADTERHERQDDIKRGRGGIREIEFLAQGFQLLRGGREPSLQTPHLDGALDAVKDLNLLPDTTVDELRRDYELLRHVENRLQAMRDQQTHRIPKGEEYGRLVRAMGLSDPQALEGQLRQARDQVASLFDETWSTPAHGRTESGEHEADHWRREWLALRGGGAGSTSCKFRNSDVLEQFLEGLGRRAVGGAAQDRLDRFMPILLRKLQKREASRDLTSRLLDLVLVIAQRSAYLALLTEKPAALDRSIDLFDRSPWVASRVSRYPELLDELIDPGLGTHIPDRDSLERSVRRKLENEDEEAALASLNYLKQATSLRVAVAFMEGRLDAERTQRVLTDLAEVIIGAALRLAERRLSERHGSVEGSALVIGYGSLGAFELGIESDLDIVFLYDSESSESNGPRPLAPERWFSRLAQRTVAFLSAMTPSGKLYEIDTRLRPNGRAGLLVSTLGSFKAYQMKQAWIWELQALTRARPIAGNRKMAGQFKLIRQAALCRPRDGEAIRADLKDMRNRIREHHEAANPRTSTLKHAPGGLIDIGFVSQAGILALAAEHPELTRTTTASGQLEALHRVGWLTDDQHHRLQNRLQRLRAARVALELEIEEPATSGEPDQEEGRWVASLLDSIEIP